MERLKNNLGMWMAGKTPTRFMADGYHVEVADEPMPEKYARMAEGLGDLLDGFAEAVEYANSKGCRCCSRTRTASRRCGFFWRTRRPASSSSRSSLRWGLIRPTRR